MNHIDRVNGYLAQTGGARRNAMTARQSRRAHQKFNKGWHDPADARAASRSRRQRPRPS